MDFFKIKDIDLPLDERDIPLDVQIQAEFDLEDEFGLSDAEYDSIDNITPIIDKQMQDTSELPEDGQFQDEWDEPLENENPQDHEDSELDMSLNDENPQDHEDFEEDPNFQGVIRTVKGANLVYKRQMPDNTFSELWIMNIGNDMKKESQIKRGILAGTDIDAQSQQSQDGKQNMDLYSVGNVQFCELTGLPQ